MMSVTTVLVPVLLDQDMAIDTQVLKVCPPQYGVDTVFPAQLSAAAVPARVVASARLARVTRMNLIALLSSLSFPLPANSHPSECEQGKRIQNGLRAHFQNRFHDAEADRPFLHRPERPRDGPRGEHRGQHHQQRPYPRQ